MEEELTTKKESLSHQVQQLKLELFRVTNELDCCKTFADENLQLKQSVRQLREELDMKEVPPRAVLLSLCALLCCEASIERREERECAKSAADPFDL